ncbi:Methyltransferase-like protein 21D [Linnemannia schmuckeri]|uniref:Methyltransferase-like protein 21D n=1 Tax=Linnemannia schmuckeri TaxID=64567 RepID=A0A9P5RXF1_9FUNG|nr:Methyltransferase-like protein 21D [Linnemannia schmuckeri]
MDTVDLSSREYEFNNYSIEPLEIFEDPSGLLHGGVGSTVWDTAIVLSKYLEKSNILATSSATASRSKRNILNILELGSGTGLVGLAVARLLSATGHKARIVLTDKANVLPLLQRNMEKNPATGIELEARVLDWEAVSGVKTEVVEKESGLEGDKSSSKGSVPTTETDSTTASESSPAATTVAPVAPNADDIVLTEWDLVILSDCIWFPALYAPLTGTLTRLLRPGSATSSKLIVAFEKRNFSEEMEFFEMLGKSFTFRDIKSEEQDPNYQSDDIFLFLCQRRPLDQ